MLGEAAVLVTNHGNHSPAKYAMACAARIVNDLHADDPLMEAKAQIKLAEVLERHHVSVREDLAQKLDADDAAIHDEHDVNLDAIADEMVRAMADTPWADHFRDHAESYLKPTIHQFLHAQVHTDKMWHADNNPDSEHGRAYKARALGQAVDVNSNSEER